MKTFKSHLLVAAGVVLVVIFGLICTRATRANAPSKLTPPPAPVQGTTEVTGSVSINNWPGLPYAVTVSSQGWEYLSANISSNDLKTIQNQLNSYGSSGWELVTVEAGNRYIFKRPK